MPFTSFAVAGATGGDGSYADKVGFLIVKELLSQGAQVKVLVRTASIDKPAATELKSLGASVLAVDYDSPASLAEALSGVEVVVSAIGGAGLGQQTPLADASKKAGVQLFVPSEFGVDTTGQKPDSPVYGKTALQAHLRTIGLPYTVFPTGPFADQVVPGVFRTDEQGELKVVGKGETPISWTARFDVASYVAHVLTSAPLESLANKVLYLEGSRFTVLELAQRLQARQPDLKITHVEPTEVLKRWNEKHDFFAWLLVQLEGGLSGWKEDDVAASRALHPAWKPVSADKYLP